MIIIGLPHSGPIKMMPHNGAEKARLNALFTRLFPILLIRPMLPPLA